MQSKDMDSSTLKAETSGERGITGRSQAATHAGGQTVSLLSLPRSTCGKINLDMDWDPERDRDRERESERDQDDRERDSYSKYIINFMFLYSE